ncbi:MAG: hypothetical protein HWD60_18830 [Defluviicoccus sp.]|nr:MAG: hypothetical protein HWD60_18830 [Defluviicoccus sp.]
MLPRWWIGPVSLIAFLLSSCTSYESHYEKGVYDLEPIYCYQTIGTVDCHRHPDARDADRLVNYYGPAPSKYDPPEAPHLNKLRPPPKGQGYWRAPEPIPGPRRKRLTIARATTRSPLSRPTHRPHRLTLPHPNCLRRTEP